MTLHVRPAQPDDVPAAADVLADATTGRPVDDLRPFLAAAGHVVVMRADGTTFAHEHAEAEDASGRPVFALPGQTFGPELDVHAEFPTAGTYRLWAQFRLADGDVVTVPFTVQATRAHARQPRTPCTGMRGCGTTTDPPGREASEHGSRKV